MSQVIYNEAKHEYSVDGQILPSVTQLAKKFSGLDTTWLEQHPSFAEAGTLVHNELAAYYRQGKELTSDTAKAIAGAIDIKSDKVAEVLVHNATLGYAGTVDLVCMDGKAIKAIIDFKTGTSMNQAMKRYYACQLNLYRLALEDMGGEMTDVKMVIVNPDGVFYIEPLSWDTMQTLAEKDPLDEDLGDIEAELASLEPARARYEELKALLTDKIKEKYNGVAGSAAGAYYTFTCCAPSSRKTLDAAKVKALVNNDEAFEACYRTSNVAASVRIKKINEE